MIAVPAGSRSTYDVSQRTARSVTLSDGTLACALLLMLVTFAIKDGAGSNVVPYLKLALRAGVTGLLALVLVTRLGRPAGRSLLWFLPLAGFVAWGGVTVLWSALPTVSLFQLTSFASLVVLGAAFATTATTNERRSRVLAGVAVGLTFLCLAFVLVRVVAPGAGSASRDGVGVLHATNTAATASLGVLLVVGPLLLFDWSWPRWLAPVALPVHAVVLLLSANRTALAVTALLVGVLVLLRGHRLLLAAGLAFVGTVGALWITVDPGLEIARDVAPEVGTFVTRGQSKDQLTALSGREEMWDVMWASFLQSPWRGHGYFVSSATGSVEVWYDEGNFTAHNLYLQALVTTGLVGLALLVCGVGVPYTAAIVGGLRSPEGRRWSVLLAVSAAWFAGWGLLNESILGPLQPEGIVFFTLLGLGVAAAAEPAPRTGVTA